jgi:integrase
MHTINFKGKQNPKDKSYVKLEMIFFKTGYARVPKVLTVTGLYKDWNQETQSFAAVTSEAIEKNKKLFDLKAKYLKVSEDWEFEGQNWSPVQWAHHFDVEHVEKKEKQVRILTIDKCMDDIIEMMKTRKRFKNGRVVTSKANAMHYFYLRNTLRDFTKDVYNRSFSTYYFKDINEQFLKDYVLYLRQRGAKKGNQGGVDTRLRKFYGVFYYASEMGQTNTDKKIFECVRLDMKKKDVKPQTIAYEYIKRIEKLDKSQFTKKEQFHIDAFLFSFYAGGMASIDVCYLTWDSIIDNKIDYERIKFPKKGLVPFNSAAKEIVKKYRKQCYGNYVLPIFNHRQKTEDQERGRVKRFREKVNKTLTQLGKTYPLYTMKCVVICCSQSCIYLILR